MVSANVDDDGNDELVSVGLNGTSLVLRVVDSSEAASSSARVTASPMTTLRTSSRRCARKTSDDDGRAEILIAAVTATGVSLRLTTTPSTATRS